MFRLWRWFKWRRYCRRLERVVRLLSKHCRMIGPHVVKEAGGWDTEGHDALVGMLIVQMPIVFDANELAVMKPGDFRLMLKLLERGTASKMIKLLQETYPPEKERP